MAIDIDNIHGCGDRYVFHYTSLAGLAGILHSGSFKFSRRENLNDPRERKLFEFGYNPALIPGGVSQADHEVLRLNVQAVFATARIACFTEEGTESSRDGYFARGWSRARAWAQYGMNHKGVCFVFDRQNLISAAREACAAPVVAESVRYEDRQSLEWADETPAVLTTDATDQRKILEGWRSRHLHQLFFEKNTDWASEREFRIVTFADGDVEVPIQSSLEAIILGEDFPPAELDVLGARVKHAGITGLQICYMQWINGCPGTGRMNADHLPGLIDGPQPPDGSAPLLIPT